jgi:hypothetical protein
MVSGVNEEPISSSTFRPKTFAFTPGLRRWSSFSRIRLLPSFSLNRSISVRQKLDDLLLLLVDPAGEYYQQKLPGVQNERHDSPMLKARGKNLSIGWRRSVVNRERMNAFLPRNEKAGPQPRA